MSNCAVKTCKNHYRKKTLKSSGISFHVFPKDPKTKEKWIDVVRKDGWFPGPRTTICSQHFEESCFDLSKKRQYLLPNAVPTLKLDIEETVQENENEMDVEVTASFVPDMIIDSPRKKKLKSRIECLERISHQRLLKIKRLQCHQKRLKRKLFRMQDLLQDLKKKDLMNKTDVHILSGINISNAEIIKRQFIKSKNLPNEKKYSENLRKRDRLTIN